MRRLPLNRKTALFAGHDEGNRTWSRIASLRLLQNSVYAGTYGESPRGAG